MKKYIILSFSILLAACDTLVQEISPSKIPNTGPKLVVGCFISPQDKFVNVRVLTTTPFFGTQELQTNSGVGISLASGKDTVYIPAKEDIIDAIVEISEGGKTTPLKYTPFEGTYRAAMLVLAGKTYTLRVTAKDGRNVTATCTIPKLIAIESYKTDSVATTLTDNVKGTNVIITGFNKLVNVTWKDIAGESNFYEMSGFTELATTTITSGVKKSGTTFSLIYFNNQGGRGAFFDDKNMDGKPITATKGLYVNLENQRTNGNPNFIAPTVRSASLSLSHVDENYYRYRRSIYDSRNQNFFTEPTLTYTNIKGGYGCFGAYNTTLKEFYRR